MAKSRIRKNKGKGPGAAKTTQARMLFAQLEREYADATPAEWEELREHMLSQTAVIAMGNERRREALVAEFDAVRDRTLAGQQTRQMRVALARGQAELVRDRGDGLEEWQVLAGGTPITLYVPAESDDAGLTVARKALLGGRCPSCRLGADLVAGTAEIAHNPLCPAKKALDA